jgi:o-succinylbenzoate synthase
MAELTAFTYAIPCTARAALYFPDKVREGLFVCINDHHGLGIGEFAPLKNFHHTTIDQTLTAIKNFGAKGLQRVLTDAQILSDNDLATFFEAIPSSLSYMLSMAHFHHRIVSKHYVSDAKLKLAALIEVSDVTQAIALAQTYVAQGFGHLKIKIGGRPIEDEIRKIKTIAAIAGERVKLRLDANRCFSFSEAAKLLQGLKRVPLEYFEEPISEQHRLHELGQHYGINLAVDESLDVHDLSWLIDAKISHVVIKPARFNNIYVTFKLVRKLKALGIVPILSHCFESEFSQSIFALMVDALSLYDNAHGIVVDGIFREGVFTQPLRSFRGQLSVSDASQLSMTSFLRACKRVSLVERDLS